MQTGGGNPMPIDEAALRSLVAMAVAADADAWEHLYHHSYPRLFAYARRRLSSDTAADDAVSETMLRALDRISGFTWQGAGFDAWLYGILRNVVLEAYRADGRVTPTGTLPEQLDNGATGPLDTLVRRDDHDQVRAAFRCLSSDDQEVLELRVVAGLSADGVAEAIGRGAGAVRMAQSRAIQRLRGHYEGLGYAD